jgi:predicted nucleic acid-binding Zn ribbon protein
MDGMKNGVQRRQIQAPVLLVLLVLLIMVVVFLMRTQRAW